MKLNRVEGTQRLAIGIQRVVPPLGQAVQVAQGGVDQAVTFECSFTLKLG